MIYLKCATLLCALLLTGCGSLLPIYQAMHKHSDGRTSSIRVENARGPLSSQQAKQVLASLKKAGPETNIFTRHLAAEEDIVGSPLMTGNKVTLLLDGPSTYKSMFAAITGAKKTSTWRPTVLKMTRLDADSWLR